MERELEKTLLEIECSIKDHERRGNTHTQSVLEQARDIIGMCAQAARTPSDLKEILDRETTGGWIPVDDRLPEEHEEGTDIYDKNTLAVMDTEYHMVSNLVNVTVYDYENEKYFVGADCTFDGEWCNFGLVTGNYEVIAWRPLPEPYRPERSEG